jgi:hypothetical protein
MQAQGQRNLAGSTPFSKKQVHCQCVGSFLFHLILFNFLSASHLTTRRPWKWVPLLTTLPLKLKRRPRNDVRLISLLLAAQSQSIHTQSLHLFQEAPESRRCGSREMLDEGANQASNRLKLFSTFHPVGADCRVNLRVGRRLVIPSWTILFQKGSYFYFVLLL